VTATSGGALGTGGGEAVRRDGATNTIAPTPIKSASPAATSAPRRPRPGAPCDASRTNDLVCVAS
jgi:hypothetical protein